MIFFDIFISNFRHKIPFLYPVVIVDPWYIIILQKMSMSFPSWKNGDKDSQVVYILVVYIASCRSLRSSFRQDLGTRSEHTTLWQMLTPNPKPDALNVLSSDEECEIFFPTLETIWNTFIGLTKRITWALETIIPISFAFNWGELVIFLCWPWESSWLHR